MKIKAIHEIHYAIDGQKKVAEPGSVVDLPDEIVEVIPTDAYAKVQVEATVEDQVETTAEKAASKPVPKKAAGKPKADDAGGVI